MSASEFPEFPPPRPFDHSRSVAIVPSFPDVDLVVAQAVKITDRETAAFFWGLPPSLRLASDLKGWALNTLAEHFRALLAGVTPDETLWPSDHVQVLTGMEKVASDYNATQAVGGYHRSLPAYPYI